MKASEKPRWKVLTPSRPHPDTRYPALWNVELRLRFSYVQRARRVPITNTFDQSAKNDV